VSRIVSQDEMDVILAGTEKPDGSGRASIYDFRRPDRVAKEQLRSLHYLHDRFAMNVSTSLSAFLRSMTEVSIVSVDQVTYSEFLSALPDPTAFYAVALPPLDMLGALELNPTVAFTMVDRMLGGTGDSPRPDRPLTEIEQNVVDSVVKLMLDHLTETWKTVCTVNFRIHGRETRPQMLQVTGPNEIVIRLGFAVRVGDARGTLNLSIPASAIEAVGSSFERAWHRTRRQPTAEETARLTANLGRVPLAVTAQLETSFPARELLAMQPGDVVHLGHSSRQPITVQVGSQPAFLGHLTQRNGRIAISVLGDAVDRAEGAGE
jgi:flagellar motor switch protein FliM